MNANRPHRRHGTTTRCDEVHESDADLARCVYGCLPDHVSGCGSFGVLHWYVVPGDPVDRPAVDLYIERDDAERIVELLNRTRTCCGSCIRAGSRHVFVVLPGPVAA